MLLEFPPNFVGLWSDNAASGVWSCWPSHLDTVKCSVSPPWSGSYVHAYTFSRAKRHALSQRCRELVVRTNRSCIANR